MSQLKSEKNQRVLQQETGEGYNQDRSSRKYRRICEKGRSGH